MYNVQKIEAYFKPPLPDSSLLAKYAVLGLSSKSKPFLELLKAIESATCCDVRVLLECIGLATSPDGINWTHHPTPVLAPGAPGQWDSENGYNPSVLFDGTTYKMWYGGGNDQSQNIGHAAS